MTIRAGNSRPSNATLRQLKGRVRDAYWKRTKPDGGQARISLGEELRRTIVRRARRPKAIPDDIRIWLVFLDEGLAFWLLVWGLYREILGQEKFASKRATCLTILSGRIFQDLISIGEMIRSGFFVQANVVTRSMIEAIDVMHLMNLKPHLAEAFRSIETNEDASKFWHTYCSRDKIKRQIKDRWRWFLENAPDDVVNAFYEQRENYTDLLGMSVHPSFAASLSSFMDGSPGQRDQKIVYAAMGSVSQMSKFTIHLILLRIFEYGILWVGPEANLYKAGGKRKPLRFKKMLLRCLNVVFSIVSSVGQAGDGPNVFFPKFKTYWPRRNFESTG